MTGAAYYISFPELVEAVGEADALKLVEALGGTRFYVRAKVSAGQKLARIVGLETARIFAGYIATGIGGLSVELPSASSAAKWKLNERLRCRVLEGTGTEASIAKELGVHGRTVRRMRRRLRAEGALPPMEKLLALPANGQVSGA